MKNNPRDFTHVHLFYVYANLAAAKARTMSMKTPCFICCLRILFLRVAAYSRDGTIYRVKILIEKWKFLKNCGNLIPLSSTVFHVSLIILFPQELAQLRRPVRNKMLASSKVSNGAKIRNRYNQVPHLTQDINGKVTNSQKTPQTRAKRSALSQQVTTKHI